MAHPYATLAQVQHAAGGAESLRQLSDWDNTGSIDQAKVNEAVSEADAMIDSFVGRRLRTQFPDGNVPLNIQRLSASIAVLKLKLNRNQPNPEDIDLLELKITELRALARGGQLVGDDDNKPTEAPRVAAQKIDPSDNARVSRDKLKGFL